MEDLYSYVTSVDGLRTLPIFEETVQQILNQTIECAFFIQAYFKHGFIGKGKVTTLDILFILTSM